MDLTAHGHGNLQRKVGPSISLPQGEVSGNGSFAALNTATSYSTPSSESRTLPGSSLMSGNDGQRDTRGFVEFHQSTTRTRWTSQSPSYRPPYTPPPRSRITPFLPSGASQSASLPRRTSEPTFPPPTFPTQTSSGPFHTHHNHFPGQYTVPSQFLPLHNQQYDPSGAGSTSYLPNGYYPFPLHPALPYFRNEASMQGPSYQQIRHPSASMPQFVTIAPGPFHPASSGGARQYPSPSYGSTTHTGFPQQFQSNNQWHRNPGSYINMTPTRAQEHPFGYSQSWSQHPRRDSDTHTLRSMESERLLSPDPSAGSDPPVSTSRNTVSPTIAEHPEQISLQDLSKPDLGEPSYRLAAATPPVSDRPMARRRYHPNPPPTRSEWVMWVGNVPNDANHDELWRFLHSSTLSSSESKDGERVEDNGIVSLFLISRSNCAFVNYHSQEQLNNAIIRFNGDQLRPDDPRCPRLVCRARRRDDDLRAGVGAQRGIGMHTRHIKGLSSKNDELTIDTLTSSQSSTMKTEQPLAPPSPSNSRTSKSDALEGASPKVPTRSPSSYASTTSSFLTHYFPKRFFIIKSLTQYDLDLSVERGVWATQKHNESILDQAFRTSKEVILIFSVNKSGEFYGYARMASGIFRSGRNVSWAPRADTSPRLSSPTSDNLPPHDTLDAPGSFHQSLELNVDPSKPQLADTTFTTSPDKTNVELPVPNSPQSKFTERRSAPPSFVPSTDHPSPRSPLNRKPHSAPLPISGKHFGTGIGRSKNVGLGDETGNHGSELQPVMEEIHPSSGGEEDPKPAPIAVQSGGLPIRSEARQDEPSWGETFRVEWLRTDRVPFHRTRHLRNPWNHGREVKVARDGTEIEPSVGQQLIDDWPNFVGTSGRHAQSGAVASSLGETKGARA